MAISTPVSIQTIVDRARVYLFDTPPLRWPDAECLQHVIWGLHRLRARRADFFIGQLATFDAESYALTSTWPLQNDFIPAFEDLVVARCMFKDNEEAMQTRGAAFFQLAGMGD